MCQKFSGDAELVETLEDLLAAVFVRAIPQRCHGEKLLSSLRVVSCCFDCLVEQFHHAFLLGGYGIRCSPRPSGIEGFIWWWQEQGCLVSLARERFVFKELDGGCCCFKGVVLVLQGELFVGTPM